MGGGSPGNQKEMGSRRMNRTTKRLLWILHMNIASCLNLMAFVILCNHSKVINLFLQAECSCSSHLH